MAGLSFDVSQAKSGPCWTSRRRCPLGSWMLGLKLQKPWTGDQSLQSGEHHEHVEVARGSVRTGNKGRGETLDTLGRD